MIEKGTYEAGAFISELKDMARDIVISVLSDNSLRSVTIDSSK